VTHLPLGIQDTSLDPIHNLPLQNPSLFKPLGGVLTNDISAFNDQAANLSKSAATDNPPGQSQGEIFVPTFSPRTTRAMFPGVFMLNTTIGILRSIASVIAVRSITRSWSRWTCS
jgi:hypothetical protein